MAGHMARYCRYPRQPKEAHGRKGPSVANVRSADKPLQEKIVELKKELHDAEVKAAADTVSFLNHVTLENCGSETPFGPTVLTTMEVYGVTAETFVGTGSPVTIISLTTAMEAMATEQRKYPSVEEWRKKH
jgi:hypothetical protein